MANPNLVINKSVNKNYSNIGDIITYTISLYNNGTATATNVVMTDLIPQGENFINNSIYVDTINKVGVNPALGIDLSSISIGQLSTVTFQAQVVNIPVLNPMVNTAQIDFQYVDSTIVLSSIVNSNSISTTVSAAILSLTKTAPSIISLGSTLTYTVNVSNIGSVTANNVTLLDTIPEGTTYVSGSATINGVTAPNSPAPPTGLNIGNLQNGYMFDLVFKVNVVSLPASGFITNYCDASCTYIVDPSTTTTVSQRFTSNIVTSAVGFASLSSITLYSNSSYSKCGDIITFTVSIPNTGNFTALNVLITDTIPNGLTFVPNSVLINGVTIPGINPQIGISVGTISAGQTSVVKFNMQVSC